MMDADTVVRFTARTRGEKPIRVSVEVLGTELKNDELVAKNTPPIIRKLHKMLESRKRREQ